MSPTKHYLELYEMHYYYFLGWTEDSFRKWCQKNYKFEPNSADASGCCERIPNENIVVIWVKRKGNLGVLVHECVHAANITMSDIGHKPNLEHDEPTTYLIEYLFNKAGKWKS